MAAPRCTSTKAPMRVWSPTLQPYRLTSEGCGIDTSEPSSTSEAITEGLLCGGGVPPFVFEIDEAEIPPRRDDGEGVRARVQVERTQSLRIEDPGGDGV